VRIGADPGACSAKEDLASGTRFEDVAAALPQVVWTCSEDGLCDYLSPRWAEFTGVPAEVHLGRAWMDRAHPADLDALVGGWDAAFSERRPFHIEVRFRRHDDTFRWFDVRATPLRDADGVVRRWLGSSTDVTDRRLLEEALDQHRAAEERFSKAFHGSPIALAVSRLPDGVFVDVNAAFSTLTGYDRSEVVGHTALVLGIQTPDVRERLLRRLKTSGSLFNEEVTLRDKSGKARHVLLSAQPTELDQVSCVIATMVDVTERRRLEAQLSQSRRMESVGKLAGGVAHDFNNLLTVIEGNVELLRDAVGENAVASELLDEVTRASEQAVSLTRQLLAFSRLQVVEPKVLDLNSIVANTVKILKRVLGEDIQLVTKLASDLPLVRIDPAQCSQVLMNLAVNARDAMPSGGRLVIETHTEMRDDRSVPPGAAPGRYAVVVVTDTGTGMSADVKMRLFEPFFTTKEVGKGTGLGLAVVHGIVTQGGGFIDVESEPGWGAVVRVLLPAVESPSRVSSLRPDAGPTSGKERLLLVEDDDAVRRVGLRVLRSGGYDVLEARTGEEACERLTEHPEGIALVITDVVMPGMSGPALAEAIRQRWPDTRIILMSGYADDAVTRQGVFTGDVPFVQKPYSPSDLLRRVREVLDSSRR
jgi:two-component system cell cycle sensor histidine kinase/response regulator CckA